MAVSTLEVLVTGNSTGLVTALSKAAASTRAFSAGMSKTGTGALGTLSKLSPAFIALGVAAVAGIGKGIAATQEWAAGVRTLARVTGDSAEFTSALAGAGALLNLDVQKLNTGFGVFAKNITGNNKALATYGVTTKDATGATLPFNEVLANASDVFLTLKPGIEQTGFAMKLFGRSGKEMIPILSKGAEGMQELYDRAKAAGLVMSQEDLDASKELSVAQRELGLAFKGASISIGKDFIPAMTTVTHALTDVVELFGLIPGPIKTAVFGFAALTGAVAALQFVGSFFTSTWAKVVGAITTQTVATGGSTLALEAETLAAGEATVAMQGYSGFLMGRAVPAQQAMTTATLETDAAMGAKAGLGGTLASTGILAGTAAAAVVLLGAEMIVLQRDAKAAHEEFESGVLHDFGLLAAGGKKAREIRELANAAPVTQNINPETGQQEKATAAILAHNKAITIAEAGLEKYRAQQELLKSSSSALAKGLDSVIASAASADVPIAELGNAVDILNTGLDKSTSMFEKFTDITGQSTDSILADLDKVVNDATSTPADVAAAYQGALTSMRQANQEWHDSIVDAFGGAGGALEKFADHADVDLSKATGALENYTGKIKSFGTDVSTIQERFGHSADDFVNWATSQGLAQAGLVEAVANSSKEDSRAFIQSWKQSQNATDTLASSIQEALDPVFHKIIDWLKQVVGAITGIPPVNIKAETRQAQQALHNFQNGLDLLPAEKRVDILVHTHAGSPWPDEALQQHLFEPLKRNGAKQIGGVWTVPLEVSAHTAADFGNVREGFQQAVLSSEDVLKTAGRKTAPGELHKLLASMKAQAYKTGELNLSRLTAILRTTNMTHKELRTWHHDAKAAFAAGLLEERPPPPWIQHALEHNPGLPEGHTNINPRQHTGPGHDRRPPVRLDRTRFDEDLAYQRDYSGFNV